MTTDIFVVSFRRDFSYLNWFLRSVHKFASGFRDLVILVPTAQGVEVASLEWFAPVSSLVMNIRVHEYDEWPSKGMMHHMRQIMFADEWTDADFICHMDSDCIFTAPVSPATYIKDGKPYLRYEPFDALGVRHPGAGAWQEPTQRCLPFPVLNETMRCHSATFHRGLYKRARELVEVAVGKNIDEHMMSVRQEYPEGFCEFNVLGNVAMHEFPDKYECVRQHGDRVHPDNFVNQYWSRGKIDEPQRIWIQGGEVDVVPLEDMKRILA